MKRIGRALHVTPTKNVILKAENLPKIGDKIVDKNLNPVGRVFDIFGPTSSPYISVKPHSNESKHFVGHMFYTNPSKRTKEIRRKKNE